MPETDPNERAQQDFLRKNIVKKILSRQADERLSRVRLVKPELAIQIETYLAELYRSGKITGEVSDEQMKMILEAVSQKRTFRIIK